MERLKVLLVEDEPDILDLVEISLDRDAELEVSSYECGEDALHAIECGGKFFDLALLDYRLPDMTAFELHQAMLQLTGMAEIRTALFTASVLDFLSQPPKVPGLIGIITKPFNPMTLAADIRTLMKADAAFDPLSFKNAFWTQQRAFEDRRARRRGRS